MYMTYAYGKFRREYGKQCRFSKYGPNLNEDLMSDAEQESQWIMRKVLNKPVGIGVDWSECEVNTMRVESVKCGVSHTEGGWPKDINPDDSEQVARYRKKEVKCETYLREIPKMTNLITQWINQNNSIDIFQRYFTDPKCKNLQTSVPSLLTVEIMDDPCSPTRPVQHLSWSADMGNLIAASYADLSFQMANPNCNPDSFVFDLEYCVDPYFRAESQYPIVKLEFHHKSEYWLAGGLTSGQVAIWDIRKKPGPVSISDIYNSHHYPVKDLLWVHSKTNTEFYTGSSDGQVMWWDARKLVTPIEVLILDLPNPQFGDEPDWTLWARSHGVSSLDYCHSIPIRFMIGTESGLVFNGNRKGKTVLEKLSATYPCHSGSVFTVQRNPMFLKCFLTIGDSQVRVWTEDVKESYIMCTNYYDTNLTDGAWSESKPSVFFTTRADGYLDSWDVLQDRTEPTLSSKVSDRELNCVRCHKNGDLVAVGDSTGKLYVLKMNSLLTGFDKNERGQMTALLEREIKREKLLEAKQRELKLKSKHTANAPNATDKVYSKEDETVRRKMDEKQKRFEQMLATISEMSLVDKE